MEIMKKMGLIPPYIIFAVGKPRTPDMHAETGRPIYFWNCLLKAVILQKKQFFFTPEIARTEPMKKDTF